MPLSSTQRQTVTQFVNFTQADKKTAEKFLKAYNWNLQNAIDDFYAHPTKEQASPETVAALTKLFDKYRDNPIESPDTIGIDGTFSYLKALDVSVEDIGVFVVSEIVDSPTLGEITRTGFINGWSGMKAGSITAQKTVVTGIVGRLGDAESRMQGGVFRRIYKHTFKIACPPGSRNLPLDNALVYWKLLLGSQGVEWKTSGPGGKETPWLDWWTTFLQERWKKAITRDLWDQTYVFAEKIREDDTMSWWSEESAWPGVIDEFVEWVKERRKEDGVFT